MLGLVFYFGIVFCLHGFLLLTVSFKKMLIKNIIFIFFYFENVKCQLTYHLTLTNFY